MMADEDPFVLVQEESSRTLLDVKAQMGQWKELSNSSSEMDQTEALQLKVRITSTLEELRQDLEDMQATVDIAAKDPAKFNIGQDELQRRRNFVSKTRKEANAISDTLEASKSRVMKNARKERSDRRGLLDGSGPSSSSFEMAGGATASVEAMAAHSKLQRDVHKEHNREIQEQQQIQQREIEDQDEQLGVLGSALGRLGEMGKVIKEELIAQAPPPRALGPRDSRPLAPSSLPLGPPSPELPRPRHRARRSTS